MPIASKGPKAVKIAEGITAGGATPLFLIAGPCVIESEQKAFALAGKIKGICAGLGIPFVFKASYDKANRSSVRSYRGPGMARGLDILKRIKEELSVPVLSDVHETSQVAGAAEVLDVLQIPAFLCRQTDFIVEVAKKSKIVNIKKGQFLAPWDVLPIIEKARSAGNDNIMITERGTSFGYNNLVADLRALPVIRRMGVPVVFDGTHSVQLPGGLGHASGGDRIMVPYLARAAVAAGLDALFLEVHPDPNQALCDGPNTLRLDDMPALLAVLKEIDGIVKRTGQ